MGTTSMLYLAEAVAFVLAWAGPVWIWLTYGRLPEKVPVHFGFTGEADGWGRRAMVWLLPAIGLLVYLGMTLFVMSPAPPGVLLFLAILKIEMLAMFCYIEWGQVRVATGETARL